jgi:hypothetical protein
MKLEGATVYNEDTCVEFHQFLVALLLGYRKALAVFHQAMTDAENGKGQGVDTDTAKEEMRERGRPRTPWTGLRFICPTVP